MSLKVHFANKCGTDTQSEQLISTPVWGLTQTCLKYVNEDNGVSNTRHTFTISDLTKGNLVKKSISLDCLVMATPNQ